MADDQHRSRRVRLACAITIGAEELFGQTVSLSPGFLQLRLGPGALSRVPSAELPVAFRLSLPDEVGLPISGRAELTGVRPETDAAGRKCTALELTISSPAADDSARIARFLAGQRQTVLVASGDEVLFEKLREVSIEGVELVRATTRAQVFDALEAADAQVLFIGAQLLDVSGTELAHDERLSEASAVRVIETPNVVDPEVDELLRTGRVFLAVRPPGRPSEVSQALRRALEAYALADENARLRHELERAHERLTRENVYLRHRLEALEGFEHIVGKSEELRAAFAELERIRRTDTTVHIHGETGTGKELVARALHDGGPRAKGPFVAQNCGGLTETVLLSTLFGHTRGAFTGALRDHPGVFEQADGGTLFLDEVAELPLNVQAVLLRALQEREITPLGGSKALRVDVRLVSATHKDLRAEVQAGRFREDLYFRLVVLHVRLPPLRDRRGDIAVLAKHFLGLFSQRYGRAFRGFTDRAIAALEAYRWPGNVRELENEIERVGVLAEDASLIDIELLSPHIRSEAPASSSALPAEEVFVAESSMGLDEAVGALERKLLDRAFARANGNVTRAAELLKVERSRLSKLRARLQKAGQAP